MYLVSACLCGVNCKYDGGHNENEIITNLLKEGKAMLVCPEQLGGLPTPRLPSEIVEFDGEISVISRDGEDVTAQFLKGARETLEIAKKMGISKAILKARSPSCGSDGIYDGTFQKKLVDGMGFTAKLLEENGISVISEESLSSIKIDD